MVSKGMRFLIEIFYRLLPVRLIWPTFILAVYLLGLTDFSIAQGMVNHRSAFLKNEKQKLIGFQDSILTTYHGDAGSVFQPIERIKPSLNGIRFYRDGLLHFPQRNAMLTARLEKAQAEFDSLNERLSLQMPNVKLNMLDPVQSTVGKGMTGVNERISRFSSQGANLQTISGPALPQNIVPGIPSGASSLNIPISSGLSAQGLSLPAGATIAPSLPSALPASSSLPGIQGTLPTAPTLSGLNTNGPGISGVTGDLEQMNGAKESIKAVTSGNLDSLDTKSAESTLAALGHVSPGESSVNEAARHAEMLKKWNSDPMYKQELAVTAAKEGAVNHFAGHEAELKAAMDQLSKAKAKVKDVEQVIDLLGKPANPMKGKPLIERLRAGINLQIQWMQMVLLDMNPYVGYRISGRWTAGMGWNERVGFSTDNRSFSAADRIYGPRAFVHYKLKESNFLILSPELMHASVASFTVHAGESTTQWVPGLMAGYRREFRYSRSVLGTVQFLYNLVAPTGQSPYASRFNLTFGFEFPLKKKQN